jgi:hypothetical protein
MTTQTFSWGVRKNLAHLATLSVEEAYHWLKENYFQLMKQIMIVLTAIVAISLSLNAAGWKEVNVLLGVLTLIGAGSYAFQPAALLLVYGANRVTKNSTPSLQKYTRMVAHTLLFMTMFLLVLATLRVESLAGAVGLLVILAGMGVATYLWPVGAWYRKVVWFILTIELVLFAYHAFVYVHPQDRVMTNIERQQMEDRDGRIVELMTLSQERALTNTEADELTQLEQVAVMPMATSADKLVRISNLECARVTGINLKRGWYTTVVDTGVIEGYGLETYATVNGAKSGDRVYVGTTQSIKLCWNLQDPAVDALLRKNPQPVHLSFQPA